VARKKVIKGGKKEGFKRWQERRVLKVARKKVIKGGKKEGFKRWQERRV
jgi:hypothetical protein